jgi:hypothetical protein
MEWLFGLAVIGTMIFLRFVLPVAALGALITGLHRLDSRWEMAN